MTPWDCCKVAFGINDPDKVWGAELSLPPGWRLVETDGTGARYVAIFRVEGTPTPEDGAAVRKTLDIVDPEEENGA